MTTRLVHNLKPGEISIHYRVMAVLDEERAVADIVELYGVLYRQHFKRPVPQLMYHRKKAVVELEDRLIAVEKTCAVNQIDPHSFITAQMEAFEGWSGDFKKFGFQASLLTGPKALERYREYADRHQRRPDRKISASGDGGADFQQLRMKLMLAEEEIGKWIIYERNDDVEQAAKAVGTPREWRAINQETKQSKEHALWLVLEHRYGADALKRLSLSAKLAAMCAVLDWHRHRLSMQVWVDDRVGWNDIRRYLSRFKEVKRKREQNLDLKDIPGALYSPGISGKFKHRLMDKTYGKGRRT